MVEILVIKFSQKFDWTVLSYSKAALKDINFELHV